MTQIDKNKTREIRVFLSSTFRDMELERDYLLKHVFPKLRLECAARHVGFTEIDLRWGVTEEASQNGRTIEICLEEINRCRDFPPFFIGFLGERYGWIPKIEDLKKYWNSNADSIYSELIHQALLESISVTELEIRFGVLNNLNSKKSPSAHFYLRHPDLTQEIANSTKINSNDFYDESSEKLKLLKKDIRASGHLELDEYKSVAEFGESIYQVLLDGLDARFPKEDIISDVRLVTYAHEIFSASRLNSYVPIPLMRELVRKTIESNLKSSPNIRENIYITGQSGLGKSSLMADLSVYLPQKIQDAFVYSYYIGADGKRDITQWRDDLLENLWVETTKPNKFPESEKEIWEMLSNELLQKQKRTSTPILLLIDAIDQSTNPKESIDTISKQLWPSNVVILISGLPQYIPDSGFSIITLVTPSEEQSVKIIEAFTEGYRKSLNSDLIKQIVKSKQSKLPLFLRMLLEELRVRSHHETLAENIKSLLVFETPHQLFNYLLEQWDADYSDYSHPNIVSKLVINLVASYKGLTEHELAELLADNSDPLSSESGKPKLPAAILNPILAVLRPYLLRNEGREQLMHRALWQETQGVSIEATRLSLAKYFAGSSSRAVVERVFQNLKIVEANSNEKTLYDLTKVIEPLEDIITIPKADVNLVRDSLNVLGGIVGEASPVQRLFNPAIADSFGDAWSSQLKLYFETNITNKLDSFVRERFISNIQQLDTIFSDTFHPEIVSISIAFLSLPITTGLTVNELKVLLEIYFQDTNLMPEQSKISLSKVTQILEAINPFIKSNNSFIKLAYLHFDTNFVGECAKELVFRQKLLICFNGSDERSVVETKWQKYFISSLEPIVVEEQFCSVHEVLRRLEIKRVDDENLPILDSYRVNCGLSTSFLNREVDAMESVFNLTLIEYEKTTLTNVAQFFKIITNWRYLIPARLLGLELVRQLRRFKDKSNNEFVAVLTNLGDVYTKSLSFEMAEKYYLEALEICEHNKNTLYDSYLQCLNNLGRIYLVQENYDKARYYLLKVLNVCNEHPSLNNKHIFQSLLSLGVLYQAQKEFIEAELYLKKCLEISRKKSSEDKQAVIDSLNRLGHLWMEQSDYTKAEEYLFDAFNKASKDLNSAQQLFVYGQTIKLLRQLYVRQEDQQKLEKLLIKNLEINRKISRLDSQNIFDCIDELLSYYIYRKQLKKYESVCLAEIDALRMALPFSVGSIIRLVNKLGSFYITYKHTEKAEVLYTDALSISRNLYPVSSPLIAPYLLAASSFYENNDDLNKAEILFLELLTIYRSDSTKNSEGIIGVLESLINIYDRQNRIHEAIVLAEEVQNFNNQVKLGVRSYLSSAYTLCRLYAKQNETTKSLPLLEKCLELMRKHGKLNVDSSATEEQILFQLYVTYAGLGRVEESKNVSKIIDEIKQARTQRFLDENPKFKLS